MLLLDRIDDWGRRAPDRVAHRCADLELRWGDLARRSDAVAGAIAQAKLEPASPVVLRGHKEPEMLIGMLACVKAGHPFVPIDSGLPEPRAQRVLAAAGAGLVLTPASIREQESLGHPRPAPSVDAESPVYVMFTSGSTGEPKGVVITRGCLSAFVEWMLAEQHFATGREVFLNQALFSFDLSVMDTWCSLSTGGTLHSLTSADIADFRRLFASLTRAGITSWVSTPTFAQLCLAERGFTASMLPELRRFLFCGDVLTPDVAARLLERFPLAELWNTYGPTEATVATTSIRVDADLLRLQGPLPIGRAMPGTVVTVESPTGERVPDGTRGEIVIVGPNVSTGYLARPDLTARSFFVRAGVRGYRTGDWGVVADDVLYFRGRMDNQVKVAGHRIEIGDVESNLASLAIVRGAAVIAVPTTSSAMVLHAFVVPSKTPPIDAFELRTELRRELGTLLPAYMLPNKVHVLEQFPLTAQGKIDRAALAAMASA